MKTKGFENNTKIKNRINKTLVVLFGLIISLLYIGANYSSGILS